PLDAAVALETRVTASCHLRGGQRGRRSVVVGVSRIAEHQIERRCVGGLCGPPTYREPLALAATREEESAPPIVVDRRGVRGLPALEVWRHHGASALAPPLEPSVDVGRGAEA